MILSASGIINSVPFGVPYEILIARPIEEVKWIQIGFARQIINFYPLFLLVFVVSQRQTLHIKYIPQFIGFINYRSPGYT